MIESIEGKRGLPRHRPPFPTQVGLFGRPTLCHNVETVYWVRELVEKGPDWFTSHGRNGRKGLRSFSVSGRVKEPAPWRCRATAAPWRSRRRSPKGSPPAPGPRRRRARGCGR